MSNITHKKHQNATGKKHNLQNKKHKRAQAARVKLFDSLIPGFIGPKNRPKMKGRSMYGALLEPRGNFLKQTRGVTTRLVTAPGRTGRPGEPYALNPTTGSNALLATNVFNVFVNDHVNPGGLPGALGSSIFSLAPYVAQIHQEYKVNAFKVHFCTACGDSIASTSSTIGDVLMLAVFDSNVATPSTLAGYEGTENMVMFKPSKNMVFDVLAEYKKHKGVSTVPWLKCRDVTGAAPYVSGSPNYTPDLNLVDFCKIGIATIGQNITLGNWTLGYVFIEYDIEFRNRVLPPPISMTFPNYGATAVFTMGANGGALATSEWGAPLTTFGFIPSKVDLLIAKNIQSTNTADSFSINFNDLTTGNPLYLTGMPTGRYLITWVFTAAVSNSYFLSTTNPLIGAGLTWVPGIYNSTTNGYALSQDGTIASPLTPGVSATWSFAVDYVAGTPLAWLDINPGGGGTLYNSSTTGTAIWSLQISQVQQNSNYDLALTRDQKIAKLLGEPVVLTPCEHVQSVLRTCECKKEELNVGSEDEEYKDLSVLTPDNSGSSSPTVVTESGVVKLSSDYYGSSDLSASYLARVGDALGVRRSGSIKK
jgi:hypothetical protein